MKTIFTQEYIIESARLAKRSDQARDTIWNIQSLEIEDSTVTVQCELIQEEYEKVRKESIDFIQSFIPKEFLEQFEVNTVSGCFVTTITGSASMNLELTLYTTKGNLRFKFDNEQIKLYDDNWSTRETEVKELLAKYFETPPKDFSCWINEKL